MGAGKGRVSTSTRHPAPKTLFCLLPSAFCLLLLSGCAGVQSALDPAGAQAGRIGGHGRLMFYVLTAVYLLVMVVLAAAVLRRRKGRGSVADEPEMEPEAGRERRMSRAVVAGAAATVVILFALLLSSYLTGRGLYAVARGEGALTVKVIGHQWWWEVRYDNQNPSLIVTTANEIHIPVGRSVLFRLTSNDVIHSFWVPNLGGKTDLIPGHETINWIRADRPGTYRGQCAEFCGHQHAHMALTVVAESPEQFKTWYDAQLRPAPEPSTPQQARGRDVFLSSPCIMCHKIQGTEAGGQVGPNLTHVASRSHIAAGTLENTRGHLAGWVLDSQKIKPGNRMPPNNLASQDLQALLDYLQSLK
ncbi:MAG TPA: cytochrome c oxidase subunit II [Pyrinomonadaceae bacterium]|nr:cytochrome c oxidase subunit II [Pyrinomonadaceae bacterium]